jgi:GNAT superfamily N-acetyltransferase
MARAIRRYGDAVPDLAIRVYEERDEPSVLALLAASLGKTVDDRYRTFFRWKHHENPFGRSLMWVGEVEGRVVGFRAFLRWRFTDPAGHPVEAVRAVDTATHPDAQGTGVFKRLTLHALDEMRPAGIDFVFNTPNDQSRPGYLKMGWMVDGRVPVQVRPRSVVALWRMVRARAAAEPWSLPVDVGEPVADLDAGLLAASPRERPSTSLTTDRTPEFDLWRSGGCASVASRAVRAGRGAVLVRFRRRGAAVECTVGELLGGVDAGEAGAAVRTATREGGADYAIASAASPIRGMLKVVRLGPVQTRRGVAASSSRLPLSLSLGDTELF